MTFVRFAGCSVLKCSIRSVCDEAPWKATEVLDDFEIRQRVRQLSPNGIVCLTGGEPTDYYLTPVVCTLIDAKFRIHIETSGVRRIQGMPLEWITVSPKTPDYVQRTGHTLKVVVRPGMTWRDVEDIDRGTAFFHHYLQPMTNPDGSTNLAQVAAMLLDWDNKDGRWALSTQAHKTWGLP